jgi:hypothetical protein
MHEQSFATAALHSRSFFVQMTASCGAQQRSDRRCADI